MNVIVVGIGKVGTSLATELCQENNEVTIIDKDDERVEELTSEYDLMGITGNGCSHTSLQDAGIENADLLVAVTGSDEQNLLCCLLAKQMSNCHTIARVRSPEYNQEIPFIRSELGLAMVINPDLAAANEIARNLRFPSAIEVDTFSRSRVDLLKFRVPENSVLNGLQISQLHNKVKGNILICAVERGENAVIPDGSFILRSNDLVSIVAPTKDGNDFFRQVGIAANAVTSMLIVGGSAMAYYLTRMMESVGVKVKIIEKDLNRCEMLSDLLPKATIIHGDGTDKELLFEEGLENYESFAALTNIDEENILLSLYAKKMGRQEKIFTKVKRIALDEVIQELNLDSVVRPNDITTENILRYVRSMNNSLGSNVQTLHKIIGGKAEALEFAIRSTSRVTNIPLQQLSIRRGILVACIYRKGRVIIPRGSDQICVDDSVVVVTRDKGLNDIEDILA